MIILRFASCFSLYNSAAALRNQAKCLNTFWKYLFHSSFHNIHPGMRKNNLHQQSLSSYHHLGRGSRHKDSELKQNTNINLK